MYSARRSTGTVTLNDVYTTTTAARRSTDTVTLDDDVYTTTTATTRRSTDTVTLNDGVCRCVCVCTWRLLRWAISVLPSPASISVSLYSCVLSPSTVCPSLARHDDNDDVLTYEYLLQLLTHIVIIINIITCSTVVLQCYRRQAIPMEHGEIRPSVTLYSLDRSLLNLVWLIMSATPTHMPILVKFGWVWIPRK